MGITLVSKLPKHNCNYVRFKIMSSNSSLQIQVVTIVYTRINIKINYHIWSVLFLLTSLQIYGYSCYFCNLHSFEIDT